jgi:predicted kinase
MPKPWRDQICALIGRHQLPFWLLTREDPERLARKISLEVSWSLLLQHAQADLDGRFCADKTHMEEALGLCALLVEEQSCMHTAYPYPTPLAMMGDIHENRAPTWPGHPSEHPFEFVLLCGVPGSGKDTYVATHLPDHHTVALDGLRKAQGLSLHQTDGSLLQEAKERLRAALRARRNVVWNATNLTQDLRAPLLALARAYGAHTRIVVLEPTWDTVWARNRARGDRGLPKAKLLSMMARYQPPMAWEAHTVTHVPA